jgi:lysozyme
MLKIEEELISPYATMNKQVVNGSRHGREKERAAVNAKGVDVSYWQGQHINWQRVAQDDILFVFLRASIGRRPDNTYPTNYQGAGAAGLLRGAYHYLYAYGVEEQARLFAETIGDIELPPVVDVEDKYLEEHHVRTFLEEFARFSDQKPMIYTSVSKWHELIGPATPWASDYDLWVAHYTNKPEPRLPQAWDKWTFWQHTNEGQVAGYEGPIDLNRFNGDKEALYDYAGIVLETPEPEAPPEPDTPEAPEEPEIPEAPEEPEEEPQPATLEERVEALEAKIDRLWQAAKDRDWV